MTLKIFREIVGAYKNFNAISLSTGSDQVCMNSAVQCTLCTSYLCSTMIFLQILYSTGVSCQRSGVTTMGEIVFVVALLYSLDFFSICSINATNIA